MTAIRYTRIQRFCLHDGPGIRTTLFLKGCALRCPWCCNPENIYLEDGWPYEEAEVDKLAVEILRDRAYFGEGGGVTYSGGEPLLQAGALAPLMGLLRAEGVHQAVETSLFAPRKSLEAVIDLTGLFLVDIKILDPMRCHELIGGDLDVYLENLRVLDASSATYWVRIPAIPGTTLTEENLVAAARLLAGQHPDRIQLLPGHEAARAKYERMGRDDYRVPRPSVNELTQAAELLNSHGVEVEVAA